MPTSVRWLLPDHPDSTGLREAAAAALWPSFMNERGHLLQTMQAFVIEADGLTVVVDTGIGNDKQRPRAAAEWHRRDRPLLEGFQAAGFDPDTVDFVVATHMHVDHVGWHTRLVDGA
jgi:glyoxylase-like metal-dependent hydrolase (beta-lactamase superfamily II)